jgi:hypothetical protein
LRAIFFRLFVYDFSRFVCVIYGNNASHTHTQTQSQTHTRALRAHTNPHHSYKLGKLKAAIMVFILLQTHDIINSQQSKSNWYNNLNKSAHQNSPDIPSKDQFAHKLT